MVGLRLHGGRLDEVLNGQVLVLERGTNRKNSWITLVCKGRCAESIL